MIFFFLFNNIRVVYVPDKSKNCIRFARLKGNGILAYRAKIDCLWWSTATENIFSDGFTGGCGKKIFRFYAHSTFYDTHVYEYRVKKKRDTILRSRNFRCWFLKWKKNIRVCIYLNFYTIPTCRGRELNARPDAMFARLCQRIIVFNEMKNAF